MHEAVKWRVEKLGVMEELFLHERPVPGARSSEQHTFSPYIFEKNSTKFLFLSSESGSEIERATSGQRLEIFGVPLLLFKHFTLGRIAAGCRLTHLSPVLLTMCIFPKK